MIYELLLVTHSINSFKRLEFLVSCTPGSSNACWIKVQTYFQSLFVRASVRLELTEKLVHLSTGYS